MTLRILVLLTTLSKLQPYQLWLRYFNACCSRNNKKKRTEIEVLRTLCTNYTRTTLLYTISAYSLYTLLLSLALIHFLLIFLGVCLNVCLDDEWNTLRFCLALRWQTKITRKSLKFFLCLCRRLTEIAFQRRQSNSLYIYSEREREGETERADIKNDTSAIWALNYNNCIFI